MHVKADLCVVVRREKDLNEVVQTTTIFANVSKGVLAKHEDMQAVFGSTGEDAICRRILQDGDLQVTETFRWLSPGQ
jgi:ribosome maturation protein SDO1